MDLAEIKKVDLIDLSNFLAKDQTSFTTLSVSCKHIESTNRISVTLSKPSAKVFYANKEKPKSPDFSILTKPELKDDCLADTENCTYFAFFNSKEKKLYTRFKDKVEANFEGTEGNQPVLFLTLTFNTTHENYSAFTTNWNPSDSCWIPIAEKNNWLKNWAVNFDSEAEPLKITIQKVSSEVSQH